MARRKLSTRGRVLAAGLCVGVSGALAGLMAATDDTGSASAGTAGAPSGSTGSTGFPSQSRDTGSYGTDGDSRVSDPGDFPGTQPSFPQPQTRTGGS